MALAAARGWLQALRTRQRAPASAAAPAASTTPTPSVLPQLPDYFARPREEALLARQLGDPPRFTVLLGPPSAGKSAVLAHVLRRWPASVAYIDLRQHSFADWDSWYLLLATHFSAWTSAATAVERAMPEEVTLPFGLGSIKTARRANGRSIFELSTLLNSVSEAISPPAAADEGQDAPPRRAWPVLVIDDAHKLSVMAQAPVKPDDPNTNGHLALQTFLDWCIRNTRQNPSFHVVLASSDSFFLDWLGQYTAGESSDHFFVGDLDRAAAEAYFARQQVRYPMAERARIPAFGTVYAAAGGRMTDLDLLTRQFARGHIAAVEQSPSVIWETELLRRALYPAAFGGAHLGYRRTVLPEPPSWSPDCARALFARLADDGIVPMADALRLFADDWKALRSLLDYQLVLYRPSAAVSDDLLWRDGEPFAGAAVVPRSPLSRFAMRTALSLGRM